MELSRSEAPGRRPAEPGLVGQESQATSEPKAPDAGRLVTPFDAGAWPWCCPRDPAGGNPQSWCLGPSGMPLAISAVLVFLL